MSEIRYTIPLVPVSKKNSQQIMVNRKTGKPFIMPSQKFRQYERDARIFLRPIPAEPIDRPVEIEYKFWMPTRRRDEAAAKGGIKTHEKVKNWEPV